MSGTLPPAIWTKVCRHAGYASLKTLLRTSRIFHPILADLSFDQALFRLPTTRTTTNTFGDDPNDTSNEDQPKIHPFLVKWVDHIRSDWPEEYKDLKVWPLRPAANTDPDSPREWSFTEACIPTESAVWPPITKLNIIVSSNEEDDLGFHLMQTVWATAERPDGVTVADLMTRFVRHARGFLWGPQDGWKFEWRKKRSIVGGIGVTTDLKEAVLRLDIHEPWSDDEED